MKIAKTTPLRNANAFFHFERKKIEFNNKVERFEHKTGIFPTHVDTRRERNEVVYSGVTRVWYGL